MRSKGEIMREKRMSSKEEKRSQEEIRHDVEKRREGNTRSKEGFGMLPQLPIMMEIKEIRQENPSTYTLFLNGTLQNYHHGQFVMLWLPGCDEKPYAISYLDNKQIGITIETKGRYSKELQQTKQKLGVRGPYGNAFHPKKGAVLIGGGLGMASFRTLIDEMDKKNIPCTLIHGAKTASSLLYKEELRQKKIDYQICTDDGSAGKKCFTTDLLLEYVKKIKPSVVYAVGPEIMMKKVVDICNTNHIPCAVSLERYMKCGYGLCGQCACSEKLVCLDGPIFTGEELEQMPEFGQYAYRKDGKRVALKEYYAWKDPE